MPLSMMVFCQSRSIKRMTVFSSLIGMLSLNYDQNDLSPISVSWRLVVNQPGLKAKIQRFIADSYSQIFHSNIRQPAGLRCNIDVWLLFSIYSDVTDVAWFTCA
jgi:hypothetical protein